MARAIRSSIRASSNSPRLLCHSRAGPHPMAKPPQGSAFAGVFSICAQQGRAGGGVDSTQWKEFTHSRPHRALIRLRGWSMGKRSGHDANSTRRGAAPRESGSEQGSRHTRACASWAARNARRLRATRTRAGDGRACGFADKKNIDCRVPLCGRVDQEMNREPSRRLARGFFRIGPWRGSGAGSRKKRDEKK